MGIDDLIADVILNKKSPIYEDEFKIVHKVLGEIESSSDRFVKKIEIIEWKKGSKGNLNLDFRRYDRKEKKYLKGISFAKNEINDLIEILTAYYEK